MKNNKIMPNLWDEIVFEFDIAHRIQQPIPNLIPIPNFHEFFDQSEQILQGPNIFTSP